LDFLKGKKKGRGKMTLAWREETLIPSLNKKRGGKSDLNGF